MSTPPMIAHRFGRCYGPDSSTAALARAASAPVGGYETDCCLTADGAIALLHDPWLEDGTTVAGWAHETRAADIADAFLLDRDGQRTDQRPLLLEEGLKLLAPTEGVVQLEIKAYANAELARRTAEVTCRRALESGIVARERLEIISFWPVAAEVAAAHGLPSRLVVACAYAPQAYAEWATEHGVTGIMLEPNYFAAEPIERWRAAGLSVSSGVCNQRVLAEQVLRFGPDFLSTDRPHELRAELDGDG